MKLERQLKTALGETRLLMLGSQVLYGFQFNGILQEQFDKLPGSSRWLLCAGLPMLTVAVAVLITPSMDHRIVERGQDTRRVLTLATLCAGVALFPIGLALALDMFVAIERIATWGFAAGVAGIFFALAMLFWYVAAWI